MLSKLVITFLPRSKRLLISWLQSPSAVIFKLLWVKNEELFDSMWWGCWLPNKSCLTHGNNLGVFQVFTNKSKLLLLRIIFPIICVHMCVCLYYTVHGILQDRILEWVAVPFSRESSQPRSPTLQVNSLPAEPSGKPVCLYRESVFSICTYLESLWAKQKMNSDWLSFVNI